MRSTDTIFALSTGRLPSGIAIIRMSGPDVARALVAVAGAVPAPRTARYGPLSFNGELLDRGLSLFFPGPASATGEDCGEFHVHGSVAVVKGLIAALSSLEGFRLAEPGEFSRRGFLNGRMDLTAVESLSDLIAAETDQQRRLALAGMSGRLRDVFLGWRAELQSLRARIEAELDFSDQDDVSPDLNAALDTDIASLIRRMDEIAARLGQAEIVRDGYRVAILGAPNAGKSSLLNALAMRDVAIVSDEAGTTRDLVEVVLEIDGFKVVLVDTAGIREAAGVVETMGIERALRAAELADLVVLLEDISNPVPIALDITGEQLRVGAKNDLIRLPRGVYDVVVSSLTGEGISELLSAISDKIQQATSDGDGLLAIRERHVGHLRRAREALQRAMTTGEAELLAEELRVAASEVGRIVGIGDTEDLLGEIFSRFCIGK